MRMIAHLDMDAFFAAVEERDNPRWKGMPIVVGADPKDGSGRGVVSTANYRARTYGIRSALPITRAWRFAQEAQARGEPETIFLPVNGRRYGEISENVMRIVARHVGEMEQASVDEAYMDLSRSRTWVKAETVCQRIKKEIFKAERLTCSIGLASNKLVAKVASDLKKPDGLTVVRPSVVAHFLAPLNIRRIPGIGPKTEQTLKDRGITTVSQIQALTEADLWAMMGEWGLDLYDKVRGIGSDELISEWTAKSIGQEETFDEDTLNSGIIGESVAGMCTTIVRTLKRDGFASFRRVVLKVRFADFSTVTRSHLLPSAVSSGSALQTEALRLLLPFFDRRENPKKQPLRLVGVRAEELA